MSHNKAPQARVTTTATFPEGYFLENLAVRADNSILITAVNKKELWYVPPVVNGREVTPVCIHPLDTLPTGLAEIAPDVFLMLAGNLYTTHESFIYKVDLRGWMPGTPVQPELFCCSPKKLAHRTGAACSSPACC